MNRRERRLEKKRIYKIAKKEAKLANIKSDKKPLVNCTFDDNPCEHPNAGTDPGHVGCEVSFWVEEEDEVLWSCPRFPYSTVDSKRKRINDES